MINGTLRASRQQNDKAKPGPRNRFYTHVSFQSNHDSGVIPIDSR